MRASIAVFASSSLLIDLYDMFASVHSKMFIKLYDLVGSDIGFDFRKVFITKTSKFFAKSAKLMLMTRLTSIVCKKKIL